MKDLIEPFLCMLFGTTLAAAMWFAWGYSETRKIADDLQTEKAALIEELTEARIMAEWDRFEEGRGK